MNETPAVPQTFKELSELGVPSKPNPPCARCGKRSTHRVNLSATKLHLHQLSDDAPKRRGGPVSGLQVARHTGILCEPCAVLVYAKFVEVLR